MQTSETINEIATALSKAQGEMGGAVKDSANPFFKSKYADLASVWDACRGPLAKHGLAIVQSPSADGLRVSVDTLLTHTSGQWMRGTVSVNAKEDSPQAVGSAITYLRRYALQSFAGVAPEDDDAEAAHGRGNGAAQAKAPTPQTITAPPKGYLDWLDDIKAVSDEGTERLQKAWKESAADYRTYLTTTAPKVWEGIKAHAAKVSEPVSA
jgi:ERF superfamily